MSYKKNPEFYPQELINIFDIFSINGVVRKEISPTPVGGYTFVKQLYPSDVDLMENINFLCESDKKDFEKTFQKIIKRIKKQPDIFITDFKAGYDNILILLKNKNELLINEYKKKGYISSVDKKELLKLKGEEYNEKVRLLYTLRWTPKEILDGKRKLSGGRKIMLEDALSDGSLVKIDLIVILDGILKEISNIFQLKHCGVPISKVMEKKDFIKGLNKDLAVYGSKKYLNSMKYAKRLYSRSFIEQKYNVLEKLENLFAGDAAKLYQIRADSQTIILLLQKYESVMKNKNVKHHVLEQIDSFKSRLAYVNNKQVSKVAKYINNIYKDESRKSIIKNLEKINKYISPIIEKIANNFLKTNLNLKLPLL